VSLSTGQNYTFHSCSLDKASCEYSKISISIDCASVLRGLSNQHDTSRSPSAEFHAQFAATERPSSYNSLTVYP
jgi:hypothetical protein